MFCILAYLYEILFYPNKFYFENLNQDHCIKKWKLKFLIKFFAKRQVELLWKRIFFGTINISLFFYGLNFVVIWIVIKVLNATINILWNYMLMNLLWTINRLFEQWWRRSKRRFGVETFSTSNITSDGRFLSGGKK